MTVIVQPNVDSNGNPQPMVYDSDTGKVIVDHDGYVLNGGQKLVNVSTKENYVSTPVTQTSGLYEAEMYHLANGTGLPFLKSGKYVVNSPMPPISSTKDAALGFIGEDLATTIITLNYSSSTAFFTIAADSLDVFHYMNFRFHNFVVDNTTAGTAPFFDADFTGATSANTNVLELSDFVFGNQVGSTAINASGFQEIECKAIENYGSILNFNAQLIDYFGYSSSTGKLWVSGGSAYLYGSNLININGNIDLVAVYGSGYSGTGFINIGDNAQQSNISIGSLHIMDMMGKGGSNGAFIQVNLDTGYTATVDNLMLGNIMADGLTANTGFVSYPFGGGLVVNNVFKRGISSNTDYVYTGIPENSPSLPTNPPASGTVYQNTNPYGIEIDLPVYATTAATAGYVTVAKGATSKPTAIANQYVSGGTLDTSEQIIRLRVPAGWYYEFTGSGVTLGTASVFAD